MKYYVKQPIEVSFVREVALCTEVEAETKQEAEEKARVEFQKELLKLRDMRGQLCANWIENPNFFKIDTLFLTGYVEVIDEGQLCDFPEEPAAALHTTSE